MNRYARIAAWMLPVSLALNLGLLAAPVLMGPPHGRPQPADLINHIAGHLPDSDGALLKSAAAPLLADAEKNAAAIDDARAKIRAALEAKDYDPAAMHAAIATLRSARNAMETRLIEALEPLLPKLSPAGRAALANEPPLRH